MDGYQARFASELHSRIENLILEKSSTLSTTVAPDYPSYTERVGFIKGLRSVLTEMKDVETSLTTPSDKSHPRLKLKGYEI